MRLLVDFFAGELGWTKGFLKLGWRVIAVDLKKPRELPEGCEWVGQDVLRFWVESEVIHYNDAQGFCHHIRPDFIVASSPCQEFSKYGLRCFYPDGPYPSMGIKLFNHTREICWKSGVPWVMENVRAAQEFVGRSVHNCGPFHLWGSGVPLLMPQGIQKGMRLGKGGYTGEAQKEWRRKLSNPSRDSWSGSESRAEATAKIATIPPELSNCVASYAENLVTGQVNALKRRTGAAHLEGTQT